MIELPSGTVTLLFTDIEGSTRLQQRLGDRAYEAVLAEHHRLLRAALVAHRGHEVDTAGDGFFAVFQSAVDAVAAAAAAQRALAAHPWPAGVAVRVRMGLHTGQPQASGERYVGLDVHRAARVEAAAHGGQVLLSQVTAGLVRDALPANVSLRPLGEHMLKDLERPEALVQLVFADLPSEFPPPRTLAADPPVTIATSTGGIYGRVFVGREAELGRLRAAYDAAVAGQGGLMMVVGEPGIGKTSLCEQLAAHVAAQGGRIIVGHCYEAGSLSLPYLAFVEALRSYVLVRELGSLRRELGANAEYVARLVPEIRDRLAEVRATGGEATQSSVLSPQSFIGPQSSSEEERYRLLQAAGSFLRAAGATQPLVVVLEDLHDADRGTLDLLTYLARNLAGARLLIAGTYRDVEVDRAHPLSSALAELRRSSSFSRVLLHGLTPDEVQRMLSGIAEQDVSWGLAEAVHRQTEGNPLFVQEVVRYLVEEGLLTRDGGRWRPTGSTPLAMSIPEGLRDVIGKRLSRLSPACNRMLATAAVIGRDFDLATLQAVTTLDEESLLDALDEAVRVAVLEERALVGGARYRFTHAFFRQTLYEELIVPRRLRLHQQVARALEAQYSTRLGEHAAELSEHFAHSSDPADLAKAVEYGELAAQRATAVYAHGEAVRHLEQALEVQEVLDPDDQAKRCDLLLELGTALTEAGEPRRVLDSIAPQAYALAEVLHDADRAGRACERAWWAAFYERAGGALGAPEAAAWAERAALWARPGTAEQVRADLLGGAASMFGDQRAGVALLTRALGLARELDEPELRWQAAWVWLFSIDAPQHADERRQLAEEMERWQRSGVRATVLQLGLFCQGSVFLERGEQQRMETIWREAIALGERTGQANARLVGMMLQGLLLTLAGRLEDAVALGEAAVALGEELGVPAYARSTRYVGSARALLYLGRPEEVLVMVTATAPRTLCLAQLARGEAARTLLDEKVVRRPGVATPEDETFASRDFEFLEAAVLVGHREAVALLLRRWGERPSPVTGWVSPTCPARHLGAAAALLGDRAAAFRFTEQALRDSEQSEFRPELALAHLQMAELLTGEDRGPSSGGPIRQGTEDRSPDSISGGGGRKHIPLSLEGEGRGEGSARVPLSLAGEGRGEGEAQAAENARAEALTHLDFATAEFRTMKMQPALERALRLKELLEA